MINPSIPTGLPGSMNQPSRSPEEVQHDQPINPNRSAGFNESIKLVPRRGPTRSTHQSQQAPHEPRINHQAQQPASHSPIRTAARSSLSPPAVHVKSPHLIPTLSRPNSVCCTVQSTLLPSGLANESDSASKMSKEPTRNRFDDSRKSSSPK